MARLLEINNLRKPNYAEACAGGAALAVALLLEDHAEAIHINDLSRPVYAFWYLVLNAPADLCARIRTVNVTMDEWFKQRAIYDERESAQLDKLGFAALFLNRTNRSGIIRGGVIGGQDQTGAWGLDARFNKNELIRRIKAIASRKHQIHLYRKDALEFTNDVVSNLGRDSFIFYDPPYIEHGQDLYLNDYTLAGHQRLAARVQRLKQRWVVTYDYAAVEIGLYKRRRRVVYRLSYSAQRRSKGREVMFLCDDLKLPANWSHRGYVSLAAPRSHHPFYGKLERTASGKT